MKLYSSDMRAAPTRGLLLTCAALLLAAPAPCAGAPEATASGTDAGPAARPAAIRSLLSGGRYPEAEAASRRLLEGVRRAGASGPAEAEALELVVESLWRSGKGGTQEALMLAERALEVRETAPPGGQPGPAGSLFLLGKVMQERRDLERARDLIQRSLALRESAFGSRHPDVVRSLNGLGLVLFLMSDLERAKPLFERALEISEQVLGPEDPLTAESLNSLALVRWYGTELEEARRLLERAVTIREKVLGPDHPELAAGLSNLASLLMESGDYEAAKRLDTRCLEIRERALGADNPLVARSLDNLSNLLTELGEYETARAYSERAARIHAAHLGPEHPDVAVSALSLAVVLARLGEVARARNLIEWSLKIQQSSPSVRQPALAVTLNEAGLLQRRMGDLAGARRTLERVLDIWVRLYGPDHPEVGVANHNLALVLKEAGDFAEARGRAQRALEIWLASYGPEHHFLADGERTLAQILRDTGERREARRRFERALGILERALGPGHPAVAEVLADLGTLLAQAGEAAGAERLLARSLAIREDVLGDEHPDVALSLNALAALHWQRDEPALALDEALRAEAIVRRQVRLAARGLSQHEALRYERVRSRGLDVACTVLTTSNSRTLREAAAAQVWDAVVRSRALVLDEVSRRNRALASAPAGELTGLVAALEAARNRLARRLVEGPGAEAPEGYRRSLEEALEARERAERALAEKSIDFRRELEERQAGLEEVRRALPEDSALVAMLRYQHLIAPAARPGLPAPSPASRPAYLAFVLRAPARGPEVLALGAADDIEAAVERWREQISQAPPPLLPTAMEAERAYRGAAARLRGRVWDPVARSVGDAARVFVVPDGALSLVSLATLPVGEDLYLAESGPLLHHLSAERELARPKTPAKAGDGLLLLGGVDFDAAPERPRMARLGGSRPQPGTSAPELEAPRHRRASCEEFRARRFPPLPASGLEVEEVAGLWLKRRPRAAAAGLVKLVGARAGEAAVKREASGRRFLHFATHSFLPSERCATGEEDVRRGESAARPEPTSDPAESPLLLSGLALAGANRRHDSGESPEDGILTAEEIAGLDLRGVEWAVLSACETGLGWVQEGEGVLGLRRAFEVAGVQTLILSLWAVEDGAAREWMRHLYQARFDGLPTAESMQRASTNVIRSRREQGRSTHPAYWGAFVAAGDWR